VVGERCLVAYNGVAPELMAPVLSARDARSHLGLDGDRPLVVYAGRVLRGPTTDLLIALARGVPEATLLVLGVEPESDVGRWLAGCARRSEADNLVIHGRVPPAAVAPFLYAADCLVVQPYDDPARRHRRHMLPIKVFSYLAARRPILAPRLPDLEEVLTDGVTACLFDARAPEDAVGALRRILVDADLRERLGRNASQLAPTYTWSVRAARLVPFLHACAAHRGAVAAPGRSVGYADRSASAAATSSRE
jgi:glycosyltransferase involved in cell wall biosynthesis